VRWLHQHLVSSMSPFPYSTELFRGPCGGSCPVHCRSTQACEYVPFPKSFTFSFRRLRRKPHLPRAAFDLLRDVRAPDLDFGRAPCTRNSSALSMRACEERGLALPGASISCIENKSNNTLFNGALQMPDPVHSSHLQTVSVS
jgi:hypothetical protein